MWPQLISSHFIYLQQLQVWQPKSSCLPSWTFSFQKMAPWMAEWNRIPKFAKIISLYHTIYILQMNQYKIDQANRELYIYRVWILIGTLLLGPAMCLKVVAPSMSALVLVQTNQIEKETNWITFSSVSRLLRFRTRWVMRHDETSDLRCPALF